MELLTYGYLIIGMIFALIIWWAAFDKGYDTWHRATYNDDPPSTSFKLRAIGLAPFMWPVYLYWLMK